MIRVFSARRGLTGALKTNKHNYMLFTSRELRRFVFTGQHSGQLVDHSFSYKLTKVCSAHITAHLQINLSFDCVAQVVDVVDINV